MDDEPTAQNIDAPARSSADAMLGLAGLARFDWDLESGNIVWRVVPIHEETLAAIDHIDTLMHECHPQDMERVQRDLETGLSGCSAVARTEFRMLSVHGVWRWYAMCGRAVQDLSGRVQKFSGLLQDIDDRHRADEIQAMRGEMNSMQRFLQDLQRINELLQMCESEEEGLAVVANAAPALFPGWSGVLSVLEGGGHRQHRENRTLLQWGGTTAEKTANAAAEEQTLKIPLTLGRQTGTLELSRRGETDGPGAGHVKWSAATFAEAVALSLANLRLRVSLREQAVQDWMTGLYNRRWFDETLQRETRRVQRSGEGMTLAVIDIDHFKSLNDAFGHEAGDLVLKAVAAKLVAFVRASDIPCRIGGDELAVLMPNAHIDEMGPRLEELRLQISQMQLNEGANALPQITVSIGVADCRDGDVRDLPHRADMALYSAKREGRNRIGYWSDTLEMQATVPGLLEA